MSFSLMSADGLFHVVSPDGKTFASSIEKENAAHVVDCLNARKKSEGDQMIQLGVVSHSKEAEKLAEIGERLRTQDNRCTMNPMFCVQVNVRDVGYDSDYADNKCWYNSEQMETVFKEPDDLEGWEEFGYRDHWETVMVAFTEGGCQEYLRLNGHNHRGETRIYVESFNRCPEMIAIREFIKSEELQQLRAKLSDAITEKEKALCDKDEEKGRIAYLREQLVEARAENEKVGKFSNAFEEKLTRERDEWKRLADQREKRITGLEKAVGIAVHTFREYEKIHLAKGPSGLNKAAENARLATIMESALLANDKEAK